MSPGLGSRRFWLVYTLPKTLGNQWHFSGPLHSAKFFHVMFSDLLQSSSLTTGTDFTQWKLDCPDRPRACYPGSHWLVGSDLERDLWVVELMAHICRHYFCTHWTVIHLPVDMASQSETGMYAHTRVCSCVHVHIITSSSASQILACWQ